MVRRSRELELVEEEAGISYPETALAKRAARARPRLAILLLVGAGLFVIEAIAGPRLLALAPALALALAAWGVRAGRLGGVVAAALAAVLAVLIPIGFVLLGTPDTLALFSMAVSLALGLGALPDVLTLVRDAELQHAYGLWARRE